MLDIDREEGLQGRRNHVAAAKSSAVTAESMDVIDFNYGTYNRTQETMMDRILGKTKGYSSKL